MGSGKAVHQPLPSASYHDAPDYAETASMSSAVLLEDVEAAFPDDELPPYQDVPSEAPILPIATTAAAANQTWSMYACPLQSASSKLMRRTGHRPTSLS